MAEILRALWLYQVVDWIERKHAKLINEYIQAKCLRSLCPCVGFMTKGSSSFHVLSSHHYISLKVSISFAEKKTERTVLPHHAAIS